MKKIIIILFILVFWSCSTSKKDSTSNNKLVVQNEKDTIRIANDSLEYEIIIFEPGFNSWLSSAARPRGYYSQNYLESRNRIYVREYNMRVAQPSLYNPSLYEMRIDYQDTINYGYEVNYLLYNYFIYFQLTYKQKLGSFTPRP